MARQGPRPVSCAYAFGALEGRNPPELLEVSAQIEADTQKLGHWLPHRIEAHVKLCVLALLLERIAEIRGADTWRNLLAQLDTIKVVEYLRGGARIRQTSEVRGKVSEILKRLGVPNPPKIHNVEEAEARIA